MHVKCAHSVNKETYASAIKIRLYTSDFIIYKLTCNLNSSYAHELLKYP
jgi:hypothetical protein